MGLSKRELGLIGYASTIFLSSIGNSLAVETTLLPPQLNSFFNSGYTNEIALSFSTIFAMKYYNEGTDPNYNTLGSSIQRMLTAFGVCSLAEIGQYVTNIGTYDPKDFVAYAVGAGLAVIVNELSFSKK